MDAKPAVKGDGGVKRTRDTHAPLAPARPPKKPARKLRPDKGAEPRAHRTPWAWWPGDDGQNGQTEGSGRWT